MSVVLILAGIYNWRGRRVILFPAAMFQLAAMPVINYPQVWQGLGMIIGVYGIGYLIAAAEPATALANRACRLVGQDPRPDRRGVCGGARDASHEVRGHLHHQRSCLVGAIYTDCSRRIAE